MSGGRKTYFWAKGLSKISAHLYCLCYLVFPTVILIYTTNSHTWAHCLCPLASQYVCEEKSNADNSGHVICFAVHLHHFRLVQVLCPDQNTEKDKKDVAYQCGDQTSSISSCSNYSLVSLYQNIYNWKAPPLLWDK